MLLCFFPMHFSQTIIVTTDKLLHGKNTKAVCSEVVEAFTPFTIEAILIGASQLRVTFHNSDVCKTVKSNADVKTFGTKCKILGGGPPPTIVHVFDYPIEALDVRIEAELTPFGKIKHISRQTYVSSPDIFTGTRIVVMHLDLLPPRHIMVDGHLCRTWFKGQRWPVTSVLLKVTRRWIV